MTYTRVHHRQLQDQFQTCQYRLLQPLAQDKTQYAWEHFQDYLNVIVHEYNSPYTFFDTLPKHFKAFHILDIWKQKCFFKKLQQQTMAWWK